MSVRRTTRPMPDDGAKDDRPRHRAGLDTNLGHPRHDAPYLESLLKFTFGGSDVSARNAPVPVIARSAADYQTPPASGFRVTWFGRSTTLLEIDGQPVLIDPTWGPRASPFRF